MKINSPGGGSLDIGSVFTGIRIKTFTVITKKIQLIPLENTILFKYQVVNILQPGAAIKDLEDAIARGKITPARIL